MSSITYLNSNRWQECVSVLSLTTCIQCRSLNGKIISLTANWTPYPPIHENCRCSIRRLKALKAGTATNNGTNGADRYLKYLKRLPPYYISKLHATYYGWISKILNLDTIAPRKMMGGDEYFNRDAKLPSLPGKKWYEADINYTGGMRNNQRILYSSDGLIFVMYDHYLTFIEIV